MEEAEKEARLKMAYALEDVLLSVIAETNDEFTARGKTHRNRHLYHFLGLDQGDVPKSIQGLTLLGFRRLYHPLADGAKATSRAEGDSR